MIFVTVKIRSITMITIHYKIIITTCSAVAVSRSGKKEVAIHIQSAIVTLRETRWLKRTTFALLGSNHQTMYFLTANMTRRLIHFAFVCSYYEKTT